MSRSRKRHNRKSRHRANSKLRNPKSVRKHKRIAGRTGKIKSKQTPSSKHIKLTWLIPNP